MWTFNGHGVFVSFLIALGYTLLAITLLLIKTVTFFVLMVIFPFYLVWMLYFWVLHPSDAPPIHPWVSIATFFENDSCCSKFFKGCIRNCCCCVTGGPALSYTINFSRRSRNRIRRRYNLPNDDDFIFWESGLVRLGAKAKDQRTWSVHRLKNIF